MKVLVWRGDREIERVTGIYYQIGWDCAKIKDLERAGWSLEGPSEPAPESDNGVFASIIHAKGMLLPEPDNPTDSGAVAVYVKFVSENKRPRECMVKIGYLPHDSKLKSYVNRPIQVDVDCHTVSDMARGDSFWARIMGLPLDWDSESILKRNIDLDIDDVSID